MESFFSRKSRLSAEYNIRSAELKTNGGSTKGLNERTKRVHGVRLLKHKIGQLNCISFHDGLNMQRILVLNDLR